VSREETLAGREKFRKIGWFAPNHKPKTKKVIATAKRLWDNSDVLFESRDWL
jgi:hypothetical protein